MHPVAGKQKLLRALRAYQQLSSFLICVIGPIYSEVPTLFSFLQSFGGAGGPCIQKPDFGRTRHCMRICFKCGGTDSQVSSGFRAWLILKKGNLPGASFHPISRSFSLARFLPFFILELDRERAI